MTLQTKKLMWVGFLALNLVTILFYWWQGSGSLLFIDVPGAMMALGRLMGLAAGLTVLLQFLFMGRMPWLERTFGLDKLAKVHKTNGKLTLLFLVLHPLLLTMGYGWQADVNLVDQYMSFVFDYQHVFWAVVGFWLFVIVGGTSIYLVRSRVKFEAWYFVHLLVYVAVFSSFWHQIAVGTDLLVNQVFLYYWIGLYVVVFTMHVAFRWGAPLYSSLRHQFTVDKVVRETDSVVSVYIKGKSLKNFPVKPGQFLIFRFLEKGMWWQAHPFSMSMVPDGKHLRISVKELGDFTRLIKGLKPGTRILIEGPYGVFTDFFGLSSKVLFVAGGIGITPIRSLMDDVVRKDHDAILLYGNRTKEDIVFAEELDQIAAKPKARVKHILSQEESFEGEKGRIDEEKIRRLVPDFLEREVFLCGPIPMMNALIDTFKKMGVASERIHYEKFEL